MKNYKNISNADITELKVKPIKYLHSLKLSYEKMISGFQEYLDYHERNGRFFKDESFTSGTIEIEKLKLRFCEIRLQIVKNEIEYRGLDTSKTSIN